MSRIIKLVLLIVWTVFALGCQTPQALSPQPAWPSPASYGNKVQAQQVLQVTYQQQTQQILVAVDISSDSVELVALSGMGIPLFTLNWDGSRLTQTNHLSTEEFDNQQSVLDAFFLAIWPQAALSEYLSQQGLLLQQSNSQREVLSVSGEAKLSVRWNDYQAPQGYIEIDDHANQNRLKLTTIYWDESQ
ncbi:DUF3261 domain-containing protein [Paraferrimonas sedimenticola]|uniref:Uncharacterized protein n=1 Tax=Paraferrimonas sedimenticola TaxID=375674 RepID=A0AA37RX95_9GAMM|nr:DUF3261 domain-containing protein [Paraferrimonas sedimenticola]GLP97039.1 hypothetical protein GCM10007895_23450 [Paraferrimonas sedimenticola]